METMATTSSYSDEQTVRGRGSRQKSYHVTLPVGRFQICGRWALSRTSCDTRACCIHLRFSPRRLPCATASLRGSQHYVRHSWLIHVPVHRCPSHATIICAC